MPSAIPSTRRDLDFDAVLRAERSHLYGIAHAILRDPPLAEDAVQDALLRAWRSWDSLRDESARRAWLVRICVNQCLNSRRAQLRRLLVSLRADAAAPTDPRLDGRLLDLDRAVLRLSPRQRAALLLHYHRGYSIDECADLMGCRPGSVRTHVARALDALRREMAT
ncbi:MAG: RNA polymerase sigma factor [Candidatus Dormibacteria bacterium]